LFKFDGEEMNNFYKNHLNTKNVWIIIQFFIDRLVLTEANLNKKDFLKITSLFEKLTSKFLEYYESGKIDLTADIETFKDILKNETFIKTFFSVLLKKIFEKEDIFDIFSYYFGAIFGVFKFKINFL
jgi:hypothetical protein